MYAHSSWERDAELKILLDLGYLSRFVSLLAIRCFRVVEAKSGLESVLRVPCLAVRIYIYIYIKLYSYIYI